MIDIYAYQTGPLGVNTYLVYDETNTGFIVDPGGVSLELTDYVEKNQINITHIILTHGHADHIGGVPDYKALFPGVLVVASEDEKEMLNNPEYNGSPSMIGKEIRIDANIYVKDEEHMTIGNMDLRFMSTPGHTKGGMCILCGDCVFSGDTLFQGSLGRTDFHGGDYEALVKSIKTKLYTLPDSINVLPGHMGITNIGQEKQYNPYVNERSR